MPETFSAPATAVLSCLPLSYSPFGPFSKSQWQDCPVAHVSRNFDSGLSSRRDEHAHVYYRSNRIYLQKDEAFPKTLATQRHRGTCLAHQDSPEKCGEDTMQAAIRVQSNDIFSNSKTFRAAVCEQCGAKMYPKSLLKSHLYRHRIQQRWLTTELKKLHTS